MRLLASQISKKTNHSFNYYSVITTYLLTTYLFIIN